jgi:hypothetical protein
MDESLYYIEKFQEGAIVDYSIKDEEQETIDNFFSKYETIGENSVPIEEIKEVFDKLQKETE